MQAKTKGQSHPPIALTINVHVTQNIGGNVQGDASASNGAGGQISDATVTALKEAVKVCIDFLTCHSSLKP